MGSAVGGSGNRTLCALVGTCGPICLLPKKMGYPQEIVAFNNQVNNALGVKALHYALIKLMSPLFLNYQKMETEMHQEENELNFHALVAVLYAIKSWDPDWKKILDTAKNNMISNMYRPNPRDGSAVSSQIDKAIKIVEEHS